MKKNITKIIMVIIILFIITGCSKVELKGGKKVAVKIKGNKITANEYYDKIKKDNITSLINMIDKDLLNKYFKTDEEEEKSVEQQLSQIKSTYGTDEATFKSVLQQFGVETEEELKENLALEHKRNKAVNEYIEKNLKDNEIKKYYDEKIYGEVKASHILITTNVKSDATDDEKTKAEEEALNKAKDIIKKLNKKEKFKDLAKNESMDKTTKENGGDLGYFNPNDMEESFKDAVIKLKKNEYTKEPVKTKYGYHIILKTDEKQKKKLKEVKDEIKEKLRNEKLQENAYTYYESLDLYRKSKNLTFNDKDLEDAYNNYLQKLKDSYQK